MTEHVKKVARVLSKKTKIKRNEMALDIASNDGTLLNFYSKNITTFGMDPLVKKFESNYKKIDYKISDFFSAIKIKKITRKKFKIITALSVFYDLLNPNKFLNDVNEILYKASPLINDKPNPDFIAPVVECSSYEGAIGSDYNHHRPIEPNSGRWRKPIHHKRIKEILEAYGEKLPDMLIKLGYESNKKWINELN